MAKKLQKPAPAGWINVQGGGRIPDAVMEKYLYECHRRGYMEGFTIEHWKKNPQATVHKGGLDVYVPGWEAQAEDMPAQRFARAADYQSEMDSASGLPKCRFCKQLVFPPRRTWCSPKCIHEFNIRSNPAYARAAVEKRDHGICVQCETDTHRLQTDLRRLETSDPAEFVRLLNEHDVTVKQFKELHSFWEMDHILEVAEGGGACGLENLQTLCLKCHHRKSAIFAGRRAADASGRAFVWFAPFDWGVAISREVPAHLVLDRAIPELPYTRRERAKKLNLTIETLTEGSLHWRVVELDAEPLAAASG